MTIQNTTSLKEIKGDVFKLLQSDQYDAACVTTNGILRKNGWAVMGAGVAKSCVNAYPHAPIQLGRKIADNGNITQIIFDTDFGPVISFPTKRHWKDPSDIELIKQSCVQLMDIIDAHKLSRVLLPKPGCANGGLNWDEVRAVITPLLDERVIIISR